MISVTSFTVARTLARWSRLHFDDIVNTLNEVTPYDWRRIPERARQKT